MSEVPVPHCSKASQTRVRCVAFIDCGLARLLRTQRKGALLTHMIRYLMNDVSSSSFFFLNLLADMYRSLDWASQKAHTPLVGHCVPLEPVKDCAFWSHSPIALHQIWKIQSPGGWRSFGYEFEQSVSRHSKSRTEQKRKRNSLNKQQLHLFISLSCFCLQSALQTRRASLCRTISQNDSISPIQQNSCLQLSCHLISAERIPQHTISPHDISFWKPRWSRSLSKIGAFLFRGM